MKNMFKILSITLLVSSLFVLANANWFTDLFSRKTVDSKKAAAITNVKKEISEAKDDKQEAEERIKEGEDKLKKLEAKK